MISLLHPTLTPSPLEYLPKLCGIENVFAISAYTVTRLILEHQEEALFRYLPLEGETLEQKHLGLF